MNAFVCRILSWKKIHLSLLATGHFFSLLFRHHYQIIKLPAIDSSNEAFMRHVGEESLWQPVRGSHEDWLKDLTLALIKSGGVKDEILRLLEPICLAKVS